MKTASFALSKLQSLERELNMMLRLSIKMWVLPTLHNEYEMSRQDALISLDVVIGRLELLILDTEAELALLLPEN